MRVFNRYQRTPSTFPSPNLEHSSCPRPRQNTSTRNDTRTFIKSPVAVKIYTKSSTLTLQITTNSILLNYFVNNSQCLTITKIKKKNHLITRNFILVYVRSAVRNVVSFENKL